MTIDFMSASQAQQAYAQSVQVMTTGGTQQMQQQMGIMNQGINQPYITFDDSQLKSYLYELVPEVIEPDEFEVEDSIFDHIEEEYRWRSRGFLLEVLWPDVFDEVVHADLKLKKRRIESENAKRQREWELTKPQEEDFNQIQPVTTGTPYVLNNGPYTVIPNVVPNFSGPISIYDPSHTHLAPNNGYVVPITFMNPGTYTVQAIQSGNQMTYCTYDSAGNMVAQQTI